MRIGFDATALTPRGKGLARFQAEFLAELARLGLVDDLTVFVPQKPDESLLPKVPGWRYVPVSTRPMVVWEQAGLPRAARREHLDVVVTTSERAALVGPPLVVYIFEHPRHRAERERQRGAALRQRIVNATTVALFGLSMRRAAAVLAASRSTARDIARYADARVVYSAASPAFVPDEGGAARAREQLGLRDGYVLHLASDDPRDNTEVVVKALGRLAEDGLRPPLVIGGPVAAALPGLRALAESVGVAGQVRWIGFMAGEELIDLYRGAIAYVDPSLYEGFGLQALEALACGVPAIASNTTSLPEVVGDAGLLFDPVDVEAFARGMGTLWSDTAVRDSLRQRALEQAARFSWERTVRETLSACADVAAHGRSGPAAAS